MKTFPLSNFLGINNRLPDFALHVDKTGDYLRAADNVDIDNRGNLHRRKASELVQAMTDAHSLAPGENYLVRDSVLYAVSLAGYSEIAVKTLSNDDPVSWVYLNGEQFYSNGVDSGRVSGLLWHPLGMETPVVQNLSAIGGSLLAGQYQVGITYVNDVTGEESGISAITVITLASTGGIRVTLPTTAEGATHVDIYVSACQGSVVMWNGRVTLGTATYDATAESTLQEHTGEKHYPLPAGDLFMSGGSLCSIVNTGNVGRVFVGSPYRYGYYTPANGLIESGGSITFPAPVTLAVGVDGGTYICAGKTYFFPGELSMVQEMVRTTLPFDGVRGTAFAVPDKPVVGWFSTYGIVLADFAGQVSAPMNDVIDLTAPASGVSIVSQSNGILRVISCGWCMNLDTKATTTYSDFDFTSASSVYGTKADGIYLIESTGDVEWTVDFGKQDFGTEQLTHLPAVYAGVECIARLRLRVQAPGGVDYTYTARGADAELKVQRFDPGKGLRATWFNLSVSESAEFRLANLSFGAIDSTRRI